MLVERPFDPYSFRNPMPGQCEKKGTGMFSPLNVASFCLFLVQLERIPDRKDACPLISPPLAAMPALIVARAASGECAGWGLIQGLWSYFRLPCTLQSRCQGKVMPCLFRVFTNSIPILITITKPEECALLSRFCG